MSDANPSLVSAGMVDEWSHLLPGPHRSAFVQACSDAGAGGDDGLSLQAVLSRYFSTWKTSLMGDDLRRLQLLATHVQIQACIKVICLEDDSPDIDEPPPLPSAAIWPRHDDGQVVLGVGVGLLTAMLAAQHLRPDRLEIWDKLTTRAPAELDPAAILARNILDGADLAVTALVLRKDSLLATTVAAELSAEHQGQGTGFSILRKAELCLSQHLNSSWARQILYASALIELSLSFWAPRNVQHVPPAILDNRAFPALEKLELCMTTLSTPGVMAMLSKSKQSLTGISFYLTTLSKNSTWAELLSRIGNDFPHLTWFNLGLLAEGRPIGKQILFPGLDKDSVIEEPYKNGLKLRQRGPAGARRIPMVEYRGTGANHVLLIAAGCATASDR